MLTRKQSWRRQSKRITRGSERDFTYNEVTHLQISQFTVLNSPLIICHSQYLQGICETVPVRSSSEPSMSFSSSLRMKPWATTGDLLSNENEQRKKHIKWRLGVRVILIPTRKEYQDAQLGDDIWWSDGDYTSFKNSAVHELTLAMSRMKTDSKSAIRMLYQPEYGADISETKTFIEDAKRISQLLESAKSKILDQEQGN